MEEFAYYNKKVENGEDVRLNKWLTLFFSKELVKGKLEHSPIRKFFCLKFIDVRKKIYLKIWPNDVCERCKDIEYFVNKIGTLRWKNLAREFPKISRMLVAPGVFYNTFFTDFSKVIVREKRQLFFSTPSRINASYEYTIELDENLRKKEGTPVFLFNLNRRCLDWLSIKLGARTLPIASRKHVRNEVIKVFGAEWNRFCSIFGMESDACFDLLYKVSGDYPCFVIFPEENKDYFLTIEYKDSSKRTKGFYENIKHYWNGIRFQGKADYWYNSINTESTHWLYVQAPAHFDIQVDCEDGDENDSSDKEVKSFSFQIKKPAEFKIKIEVPSALKMWYKFVLWLSFFVVIINVCTVVGPMSQFLQKNESLSTILSINIGVVAVVATTRGWMIHEEHILSFFSKVLSYDLLALIFCCFYFILFSNTSFIINFVQKYL